MNYNRLKKDSPWTSEARITILLGFLARLTMLMIIIYALDGIWDLYYIEDDKKYEGLASLYLANARGLFDLELFNKITVGYAATFWPFIMCMSAKLFQSIFVGRYINVILSTCCIAVTYNLAYDEAGNTVGCAVNVAPVGFGGPISIKVGFDANGVICNTKVLSQAETPGLGAKCTEPAFADQFKGWDASAKKLAVKKDGGDVDAITASTITSRAYSDGLALAVQVFATIAGTPMPLDSSTGASVESN